MVSANVVIWWFVRHEGPANITTTTKHDSRSKKKERKGVRKYIDSPLNRVHRITHRSSDFITNRLKILIYDCEHFFRCYRVQFCLHSYHSIAKPSDVVWCFIFSNFVAPVLCYFCLVFYGWHVICLLYVNCEPICIIDILSILRFYQRLWSTDRFFVFFHTLFSLETQ